MFIIIATGFLFVSTSADVYNLMSPPALSWHIALRKAESIVAFALVGGSFVWASGVSLRSAAVAVALYSGVIEVLQFYVDHSHEGPVWNAVDVVCGAIGGSLGALIPGVRAR
jgi:hypothetical protein